MFIKAPPAKKKTSNYVLMEIQHILFKSKWLDPGLDSKICIGAWKFYQHSPETLMATPLVLNHGNCLVLSFEFLEYLWLEKMLRHQNHSGSAHHDQKLRIRSWHHFPSIGHTVQDWKCFHIKYRKKNLRSSNTNNNLVTERVQNWN